METKTTLTEMKLEQMMRRMQASRNSSKACAGAAERSVIWQDIAQREEDVDTKAEAEVMVVEAVEGLLVEVVAEAQEATGSKESATIVESWGTVKLTVTRRRMKKKELTARSKERSPSWPIHLS
jgi:hypothetical protein